jgi:hypothetical protein
MSYLGNTPTQQAFTPAIDFFSGNGSTVAFTLSRPVASVAQVQATIENVPQNPGTAFTVSGNTITFDGAPPSGTNNIYVYYTSPITQVIQPGQGTVGTAQIQNGAVIPEDLSTGGPVWNTSGNLGIGTSPSSFKLDARSDTPAFFGTSSSDGTRYGFTSALPSNSGNCYVGWIPETVGSGGVNGDLGLVPRTSAGANIRFFTGSTSATERMRINAAGQITTPSQPAFFANNPSSGTVNTYFAFNSVKVNRGGHYNSSNGRFTAPVAGVYSFIVSALGFGGSVSRLTFRVNGSDLYSDASAAQCRIDATASGSELPFGSKTAITSLNANDYIQVYYGNDSSSTMENLDWVCFGGQLIG